MRASRILLAVSLALLSLPLLPSAPAVTSNCDYVSPTLREPCYAVAGAAWRVAEGPATGAYCLATGQPWDGYSCSRPGALGLAQGAACGVFGREPRSMTDLCVLP